MGFGVAIPVVNNVLLNLLPGITYTVYRRVHQAGLAIALLLFISGILVKHYWKGKQAQQNPLDEWINAYTLHSQKSFDWTGVGYAVMALGPGLFLISYLSTPDFKYAEIIGVIVSVLLLLVGVKIYLHGKATRAAQERTERLMNPATINPFTYPTASAFPTPATNSASTTPATSDPDGQMASDESNLPQNIPEHQPEAFVLVHTPGASSCGLIFFGCLTLAWYGFAVLGIYLTMIHKPVWPFNEFGIFASILYLLLGLFWLYRFLQLVMAKFAFANQVELILPHWPLETGDDVEMTFRCRLRRRLPLKRMEVSLEYKTDYGRTPTEPIADDKRTLTVKIFEQEGKSIKGNWKIAMPTDWPPPCESFEKVIDWRVIVTVEFAKGRNGIFSFPLLVVPKQEIETGERSDRLVLT
jgi:hypothetical protein